MTPRNGSAAPPPPKAPPAAKKPGKGTPNAPPLRDMVEVIREKFEQGKADEDFIRRFFEGVKSDGPIVLGDEDRGHAKKGGR